MEKRGLFSLPDSETGDHSVDDTLEYTRLILHIMDQKWNIRHVRKCRPTVKRVEDGRPVCAACSFPPKETGRLCASGCLSLQH